MLKASSCSSSENLKQNPNQKKLKSKITTDFLLPDGHGDLGQRFAILLDDDFEVVVAVKFRPWLLKQ